jgi:hypothetical protein
MLSLYKSRQNGDVFYVCTCLCIFCSRNYRTNFDEIWYWWCAPKVVGRIKFWFISFHYFPFCMKLTSSFIVFFSKSLSYRKVIRGIWLDSTARVWWTLREMQWKIYDFCILLYLPVWWTRNKNSPTVTYACRKRRLKWVATLPLGDINTEVWSSGMGVGRGANNPTL